jgi:aspartate carbamoyltransferase catalytic subunit
MRFDHRHLLGIEPLRPDEITTSLDLSDQYVDFNRRRDTPRHWPG